MRFSQEIRQEVVEIWNRTVNHPFVQQIGEGSLPLNSFRYYIMQDSYYLSHFARVQSLGAAKAKDFKTMKSLNDHARGTYEAEMALHQTFADLLDITDQEKFTFEPAPTAYAYTSHLYRAAYQGHLGDIIAAILPCYWIYHEVGEQLKECRPESPIYQKWIEAYGSEWFKTLVDEQIDRLDLIAEKVTEQDRKRMKKLFAISVQYEYMFWEMAYTIEKWPH